MPKKKIKNEEKKLEEPESASTEFKPTQVAFKGHILNLKNVVPDWDTLRELSSQELKKQTLRTFEYLAANYLFALRFGFDGGSVIPDQDFYSAKPKKEALLCSEMSQLGTIMFTKRKLGLMEYLVKVETMDRNSQPYCEVIDAKWLNMADLLEPEYVILAANEFIVSVKMTCSGNFPVEITFLVADFS